MKCLSFNCTAMSTILLVFLSSTLTQIKGVEAYIYPSYANSVDATDWFLEMYADARRTLHSRLNRSTMFLDGWNVSDDTYVQAIERYCLGEYMASTVIAYELTSNVTYLAEAKWLIDRYLLHEGEGISYPYTWALYERTPMSNYGWLHHDVMVWWTMQKLNEHGSDYNVTGRVDEAVSIAYYNNETDLAWEYYYWQRTGDPANYVVNAFVPMLFIMSYLTDKNVKDYTADVQRIYNAAEKFRLANHKYKYKWTDTGWNNEYGLYTIRYFLLGEKYLPNIFSNTKLQQTIDAHTYSDIYEAKTLGRAGAVAVLASCLGFTISDPFRRVLRLLRDQYHSVFSEFYMFDNLVDYSKYYGGVWAHVFMTNLGFSAGTSITFPTISYQVSDNFIYFNTVLRNVTSIYSSPSYAAYPLIAAGYASSRTHAPISTAFGTAVHFNETMNAWQRNETWAYDGYNLTFRWDKYAKNFNWTATGRVRWRLTDFLSISTYPLSFVFPNGTVTSMIPSNTTLLLNKVFAIEVKYTDRRAYWLLFKTDNASVSQYTYGPNKKMYLWSYISLFNHWRIDESPYLDNTDDWNTVRAYIQESLHRLENNLTPVLQESVSQKTFGRIIHSDANISDYNDQIELQSELCFNLTYVAEYASATYVYAGDKGEPISVSGASDWSYDDTAGILTLTAIHTVPEPKTITVILPVHDVAARNLTLSNLKCLVKDPNQDVIIVEATNFTEWNKLFDMHKSEQQKWVGGKLEQYHNQWGFRFEPDTVDSSDSVPETYQAVYLQEIKENSEYWSQLPSVYILGIVTNINFTQSFTVGETLCIYVEAENQGSVSESFNVSTSYTRFSDPLIGRHSVNLTSGTNKTLTFEWMPNATGRYIVHAEASIVAREVDISDNNCSLTIFVNGEFGNADQHSPDQDSHYDGPIVGSPFIAFIFGLCAPLIILTCRKQREISFSDIPATAIRPNLYEIRAKHPNAWQDSILRRVS